MSKLTVTIPVEPENPDGAKTMTLEPTENYNFVAMKIGENWYEILTADLYRAIQPFMDIRHEGKSEE